MALAETGWPDGASRGWRDGAMANWVGAMMCARVGTTGLSSKIWLLNKENLDRAIPLDGGRRAIRGAGREK